LAIVELTCTLMLALVAQAQSAPSSDEGPIAQALVLGAVVVTAHRPFLNLQTAPETAIGISRDTIQKLDIVRMDEIQDLAPGLSLDTGVGGYDTTVSLRGINYDIFATSIPTVDVYFNGIPLDRNSSLHDLYDVGQIDVLRGTQGALRGRSAPSGAIILTTKRPDLDGYGGYISAIASDQALYNFQGAVDLPIVRDKLALRIAGLTDQDDADGVRSVFPNMPAPRRDTDSVRASLRFRPSDDLDFTLTYQDLRDDSLRYPQVAGPGDGYNGPGITVDQRLSVASPHLLTQDSKYLTLQGSWDVLGQNLFYVGGFQQVNFDDQQELDDGHVLLTAPPYQIVPSKGHIWTNEIRLSSTTPIHHIDYTVGVYISDIEHYTTASLPQYLDGAFGSPASPNPATTPNAAYVLPVLVQTPNEVRDVQAFASLTLHIDSKTDLLVGGRYIHEDDYNLIVEDTGAALDAAPAAAFGGVPCAFIPPAYGGPFGEHYPGYCDIPVAAGVTSIVDDTKSTPILYSASLTHRFTDDLMAYARSGSSWRAGGPNILTNISNPVIAGILFTKPETSSDYELGLKANWLNDRLRLDADIYRQDFTNLIIQTLSVPYLGVGSQITEADTGITANANAQVNGVEVEAAFRANSRLDVSFSASYAVSRLTGGTLPCINNNVALTPTNPVNFCRAIGAASTLPPFSATLQAEYIVPIGRFQGYIRGLLTYHGGNANSPVLYHADSYSLLNLYVGLQSGARWDFGLFAKNAFGENTQLTQTPIVSPGAAAIEFASPGYTDVTMTPKSEYGVSLRYAFGSR
jgi:iron complex outermembrane receptor protein